MGRAWGPSTVLLWLHVTLESARGKARGVGGYDNLNYEGSEDSVRGGRLEDPAPKTNKKTNKDRDVRRTARRPRGPRTVCGHSSLPLLVLRVCVVATVACSENVSAGRCVSRKPESQNTAPRLSRVLISRPSSTQPRASHRSVATAVAPSADQGMYRCVATRHAPSSSPAACAHR